jgi:hypothetical protein
MLTHETQNGRLLYIAEVAAKIGVSTADFKHKLLDGTISNDALDSHGFPLFASVRIPELKQVFGNSSETLKSLRRAMTDNPLDVARADKYIAEWVRSEAEKGTRERVSVMRKVALDAQHEAAVIPLLPGAIRAKIKALTSERDVYLEDIRAANRKNNVATSDDSALPHVRQLNDRIGALQKDLGKLDGNWKEVASRCLE